MTTPLHTTLAPFEGFACYYSHSGYSAPAIQMYGYSSEEQLHRAIRRRLKSKLPKLTITFANGEDLKNFSKFVSLCQTSDGTVTGVYAGIACSALKRSKIV